jgi:Acyl-CoA dehydrogenase, C-terminal domain
MDGEELDLFERSLRHATERHSGGELDAALDELGWADALAEDQRAAVSLLFASQGAANATSGALDHVIRLALGPAATAATGVVLPAIGQWDPAGILTGRRLHVDGIGSAASVDSSTTIVVATDGSSTAAATVPTASLTWRPAHGVDPSLGLHHVTADAVELLDESPPAETDWSTVVSAAQRALAHELVGAARTMLALARDHALDREQFGRPIAGFQAVRHRLAETLVAIELAEASIDVAWLDGSPTAAAMAKAVAGREARTAARHCQQILAGIGFTTEHDLHRYVRRVLVLHGLFGTDKALTTALGTGLLESRMLPPLVPL